MKYLSYILFLLLIVATSCKKPEEHKNWTEIHVSASNFITNEPLNDIYIGIIERKQKAFSESELTVLSEGFTNVDGEYHFGWKANNNSKYSYEYVAQAELGKYYKIDFLQFDYLSKGETHSYNIELIPYSNYTVKYENQNCFDSSDSMWTKLDHSLIKYQSEEYTPFARVGCYNYIDPNVYSIPIGDYEITMKTKRNGTITYETVNFSITEGQTTEIELFY